MDLTSVFSTQVRYFRIERRCEISLQGYAYASLRKCVKPTTQCGMKLVFSDHWGGSEMLQGAFLDTNRHLTPHNFREKAT